MLVAVQLAGPLPGKFLLLALLQPVRPHPALGAGQAAPQPDVPRIQPDFIPRNLDGHGVGVQLLRRIAAGRFPHLPGEIVVHHPARRHREVVDAGRQAVVRQRQVARITRQQPPLPMGNPLPGVGLVLFLRLPEHRQLRVAAVDQPVLRQPLPELFVAPFERRVFHGDFAQRFRMRVEKLHAVARRSRRPPGRLRLRLLHRVQHRIQQVERQHHHTSGPGDRPPAASRRFRRPAAPSPPTAAAETADRPRCIVPARCTGSRTDPDRHPSGAAGHPCPDRQTQSPRRFQARSAPPP